MSPDDRVESSSVDSSFSSADEKEPAPIDLTPEKDGGVLKEVIKPGKGNSKRLFSNRIPS